MSGGLRRGPGENGTAGDAAELALFPLHTVLFPEGTLRLRLFEPRYLDMVSRCLRSGAPFGVCLIREGEEAGTAAHTVDVGTTARIRDWSQLEDGLLGISAEGEARFRVLARHVQSDQLVVARVLPLAPEPGCPLPEAYTTLAGLLKDSLEHLAPGRPPAETQLRDATWVGYRLAELLPVPLTRKQYFLELEDPVERLRQIEAIVHALAER